MNLFRWSNGRQGTGYAKFPLLFSKTFKCDAYVLKIPKGVAIPKHTDPVVVGNHHRINITLKGRIWMFAEGDIFRIGHRVSLFKPDIQPHWADAVDQDTYLFSFGWLTNTKK